MNRRKLLEDNFDELFPRPGGIVWGAENLGP